MKKILIMFSLVLTLLCSVLLISKKDVSATQVVYTDWSKKTLIFQFNDVSTWGLENQNYNIPECDVFYFYIYNDNDEIICFEPLYYLTDYNQEWHLYYCSLPNISFNITNYDYYYNVIGTTSYFEYTSFIDSINYNSNGSRLASSFDYNDIHFTFNTYNNGSFNNLIIDFTNSCFYYNYFSLILPSGNGYFTNGLSYGYTNYFSVLDNSIYQSIVNYLYDSQDLYPLSPFWNSLYANGYAEAYSRGLRDGSSLSSQDAYERGKADGLTEGLNTGQLQGYIEGKNDGIDIGFNNGYDEGSSEGYDLGYNYGYSIGLGDGRAESNMWFGMGLLSLVDIPFNIFRNIFDFDLFGFNFYNVVFALLTLGVVIWLLKKLIFNKE